jgi:phage-related protein
VRKIEIFKLWGSIDLKGADQAGKDIEDLDKKAGKSDGVLSKLGETGAKFGGLVAKGAVVAGAGLVGLVAMSDSLQKAFNGLQASTGATEGEMRDMEKSLKNIYKNNYGESIGDIASSMANVKQNTGLAGAELEKLTQSALMLRDTFAFEVEESTRAADTMMKQFGISGEEAMTLIAQGAQQGANRTGDLLDTINEYAPQFKAIGIDAEFMMDTLITGAQNGSFSIDKVGDAVKEMNIRMKDGNKETKSALTSIGLNAAEITKAFAKGGDAGQQAFIDVVNALADVEDPMKKNIAGVAIMGTQYEDLEGKAIDALADIGYHTDMTGDTLKQINSIKYDTISEALKGVGRNLYISILEPIQSKIMPAMNDVIGKFTSLIEASKDLVQGDFVKFSEIVTKAFGQETGLKIMQFVLAVQEGFAKVKEFIGDLKTNIMTFVTWITPFVIPILEALASFIQSITAKITSFWQENGAQITQAVKNAFNMIKSIIEFVMPAVLFIIKTVWGNIKGVIDGALNIIMGLIKVFAGIFTGDFSKMWEGVKQLFSGALEFLWNLINLMLIGKLIGGIKAFVTGGIKQFTTFWNKAVEIFKNLDDHVFKIIGSLASKVVGKFKSLYDEGARIFGTLRTFGANAFEALKQAVFSVVSNMVKGVKDSFSSLATGAKHRFEGILSTATSIFGKIKNAITNPIEAAKNTVSSIISKIKGLFSNMKVKIPMPHFSASVGHKTIAGIKIPIPDIDVDWYAQGTNFAPGGLAVVGERGPELLQLPRGSKVRTNEETKQMMNHQPVQPVVKVYIGDEEIKDMMFDYVDGEQNIRQFKNSFMGGYTK